MFLLSVHRYECGFCRIAHDTLFHMRGPIPYVVRDAATASGCVVICGTADRFGPLDTLPHRGWVPPWRRAQLGARFVRNEEVVGSNPIWSTFYVFSCLTIIMKPNLTLYTRDTIETYQPAKGGFSL